MIGDLLLRWMQKGEKPIFVLNKQEFMSLWSIAHAWEGLDPESTDLQDVPDSIQANLDILMLAYHREEIALRNGNG
ncbi:MAG: hypothetical protein K9J42_03865 [Sulfuritalea sp.]|nr:hypothetical protein [Sulfuritalea sp.]